MSQFVTYVLSQGYRFVLQALASLGPVMFEAPLCNFFSLCITTLQAAILTPTAVCRGQLGKKTSALHKNIQLLHSLFKQTTPLQPLRPLKLHIPLRHDKCFN